MTTIDAQQAGMVVTCNSGEGAQTVLEGFTITGGNAIQGGGMANAFDSIPTVADCAFIGNTADEGGGMFTILGFPTVTDCTFTANSAGDL